MLDDRLSQTRSTRAAWRARFRLSERLPGPWLAWLLGALALAGVVGLVVFVAAGLHSGEAALAEKIQSRLAARLHADVTVGEIGPKLDGGVIRDVTIRAPGGFRADAEEVRVPLDLWGLAADGGVPFKQVRLRGLTVVVDPRSDETRSWLRSLLGHPESGPAGAGGDPDAEDEATASGDTGEQGAGAAGLSSLELEISDVTVKLLDAEGEVRDFLSAGAFAIAREGASEATINGSAVLAGGGRLSVDGSDRDGRSELAASVSDMGTRWLAPLLPDGVALRDDAGTLLTGRVELSGPVAVSRGPAGARSRPPA